MEANNHFNYGTHSVSANSGLKLSSGDSLYTNGSSMSFPHQAKNINGEMNVNGVTTVIGSGVPGSHPPTAPYPHMSNHHQNSMGYDYLWGGQSQYNPAMSSSPGLNMHQKQPPTGMMQPQSQHHFQGHGQYQHNGGMGNSRQPPVAAPPNVSLSGSQYWNRGNPGQQQMGYNSHSVYGAYQSAQVHPGIVSSQHHQQQQQQILQPTPHQQTPQHLHPHHHPHHHHHQQQQHQQPPQHYGMVPNGMPYYQHQPQHPPLPSPQPQPPPPPQSQPPAQAQMMPPTAQNYTPPRGSPQHHNLGRGGTGSPLPMGVSSVQMISPTTGQEGGSPQSQTRERSPHGGNVGIPVSMQGRLNEAFTEVDNGYNGMERGPVGQHLSKSDSYPPKPPGPPMGPSSDYCQRAEPPTAQRTDLSTPARESAMTVLPHSMSSPSAVLAPPAGVSTSPLSKAPTPPRVSAPPTLSSPGPPAVPSPVVVSSPPRNLTPPIVPSSAPSVAPRLSSPPLMVQGLRPPPATLGSPSSAVCASPTQPKSAATPPVSAPPPLASASSYTLSTPISALQQMVQGSRPPPLMSGPPAGAPREKPGSLSPVSGSLAPVSATVRSSSAALPPSSTPAPPASVTTGPHPSLSAPPTLVSRAPTSGAALFELTPKPPQSLSAPIPPVSASTWASAPPPAASSSPNDAKAPRPTSHGPRALPTTGPPPLTSQAPKSASVCAPSSFMSAPPVLSAASGLASQVTYPTQAPKATATHVPEHEASEDERGPALVGSVGKPKADVRQSEAEAAMPPPNVEVKETLCADTRSNASLPDSCGTIKLPEKFAKAADGARPEEESHMSAAETPVMTSRLEESTKTTDSAEEPSTADSSCPPSSRAEDNNLTDELSSEDTSGPDATSAMDDTSIFKDSSCMDDTSRFEDSSCMDDTSRFEDSSCMDDTSRFEDSSCMDDTSRFEDSSRMDGTSQFEDSSRADDTSQFEDSSRMDGTSQFEDSSRADDTSQFEDSSRADGKSRFEDSSHLTNDATSRVCNTTRDSLSSTDNLRDETQEVDSSLAGEAMDRGHSTRESSLNDTSRMDESCVDSFQNNESLTGSFSPQPPPPYNKGSEVEAEGVDKPDPAGSLSGKTGTTLPVALPVLETKDGGIASLEPPAECPVVPPLLLVASQACPPGGGKVKTPGKTRKPRAPKSSTPVSQGPGQAPQKATIKTPKVAKIKKKLEKGGEGEKEKEKKEPARKRKRSAKVAAADKPSGVSAEADLEAARQRAIQDEQIKAIIEACLATDDSPAEEKPKKAKKNKKVEPSPPKIPKLEDDSKVNEDDHDGDDSSTAGEIPKRRAVATEEQVHFPMLHGWRREIRVKKLENRMKGETWYYSPCGRRMKQFPEVIKYLNRHQDSLVTREHFSFSPRMPVGDFYEERETPAGQEWCLLTNEEVPSMIMAITGRRGRPPNPDKEKPRRVRGPRGGQARRPGRPPKPTMVDLLSKVDARLLKRLEAKETPTEEDKEKLAKIKKKMKRKARMKRKEDAKCKKIKEDKKKPKTGDEPEANEPEVNKAEVPESPVVGSQAPPHAAPEPTPEPKKPGRRKRAKVDTPPPVPETDQERIAQGKRVLGARSKAKALAKAQAEAQAATLAAAAAKRQAERKAQAQRRLEERKRQQLILEELKKPNEDMCLTDHRPLPELSRITGLVLSGRAFSHCLTVVEFLHSYGKVLGLDVSRDIPTLCALQEGLLGLGDGQGDLQDLVLKLLEAALHDPGLPSFYQSVKILGEKLVDLELTRSTVSEGLRIFLEAHGFETAVCDTLRTKPFLALSPDTKAAILGFLVDELNGSNLIVSEIDNTLENMATYRKNKWIIEGKLRKLKSALARRTGRSEDDLCLEERRRSARVAEEEHLSLEESDLMERSSRRSRKEEAVLSDQSDSPTNASIPELERQIDKLTKRQAFFRKKLLQSSHSMRAVSLGQDRFRRRYWALPQIGGVLVEGPEEILTSEDILVAEVPVTFMKKEPKVEEVPVTPTGLPSSPTPSSTPGQLPTSSPEEDPLPGTASLMSQPRGRGRPRKIKPEVELHLRTAKMGRRRRRRSSKSGGEEAGPETNGTQNLTQAAFQSWLSQPQEGAAAANGTGPEDSVKDAAEKQGQWFNLLPKEPCDSSSLTEPQAPASPGSAPPKPCCLVPLSSLPAPAAPLTQSAQLPASLSPAVTEGPALPPLPPPPPPPPPPPSSPPTPPQEGSASTPSTPARPCRRRRRGSRGSSPARRGSRGGVRAGAGKRRGRPPCTVFQELEQQYFTQLVVKPIPTSMVRGWWWITEPEELHATLQALHPRGTREKVLHKHLAKHMESLVELVTKGVSDPIFQVKVEEGDPLTEALQQPWQVMERSLETDVSALRWVEDLEQRVVSADLHLKVAPQSVKTDSEGNTVETPVLGFQPYTVPEADSSREDLQYYQHDADPRDDWIVRTKKEWSDLPRVATHPLDLAVLRLANLERNIERRYLKEPLWNLAEVVRLAPLTPAPGEENPVDVMSLESEITPRLRTWRQGLDRCRSAPQLCLCLLQLEKAIAWERSVVKVMCQVCRKGDNDEYLLLCDGCDRGCHMYCLKPKVTQVPEGDWFCPACISQALGESQRGQRSTKQRVRVKKRRYEDDSSDEETGPRRAAGMVTRHKDAGPLSSSSSRYSGDGGAGHSPSKRRRMTTRNQPDLTYCEIILMEMEAHADAWPFLEPVNPRLVPGYRRIVKSPMDFLTMRERLLQGGYSSCEEFAADAELVFNNCELFNEDTSEVGVAGHAMRRFFESRWAEFYDSKDK